jgi:hypothetical protein
MTDDDSSQPLRFVRLDRHRVDRGEDPDRMELSFPLPQTESGYEARRCPNTACRPGKFQLGRAPCAVAIATEAEGHVRRKPGEPGTTCPYCGTDDADDAFIDPDDRQHVHDVVEHALFADVVDHLRGMFEGFNRESQDAGPFAIRIDVDADVGPPPAPPKRDELYRPIACSVCRRPYVVYGRALFCPDCGVGTLADHISHERSLIRSQLDDAEREARTGRHESAQRRYANAHEDVTTVLEAYLKQIYAYIVARRPTTAGLAATPVRNDFQNIARTRKRFSPFAVDPFAALSTSALDVLGEALQHRHVGTHNLGIADAEHVATVGSVREGELVVFTRRQVEEFFDAVEAVLVHTASAFPELRMAATPAPP